LPNKKLLKELRERTVHQFLDIMILEALHDSSNPMSGCELVNLIHKRFGVTIDSGMIFSLFVAMERKGLIHGFSKEVMEKRTRRFYVLTETGKEISEDLLNDRQEIINFVKLMFKENAKLILH